MQRPEPNLERLGRAVLPVFFALIAMGLAFGARALGGDGGAEGSGLAVPIVLIAVGGLGFLLPPRARIPLAVTLVLVGGLLFAADGWFELGRSFGEWSAVERASELRRAGVDAWPASQSHAYLSSPLRLPRSAAEVIPLGSVANATEVLCREGENPELVLSTDERGFANPRGAWSGGAVDVVLVGDSFAQGFCVPAERSLAALIRRRHPRLLNLAGTGNGPLAELGTLVEYAAPLRPSIVLWFYYEHNDLDDWMAESRTLLLGYERSEFSQELVARNDELQAAIRARLSERMAEYAPPAPPSWGQRALRVLRLANLRERLGWTRQSTEAADPTLAEKLAGFERVLRRARALVGSWKGRLVAVYLPRRQALDGKPHPSRGAVLRALRASTHATIDLHETFVSAPQARGLFASDHPASHYTPRGQELVAEVVLRHLDRHGPSAGSTGGALPAPASSPLTPRTAPATNIGAR